MANHPLTYTGAQVQALLDEINDLGNATTEEAGLMSAADKGKLDGIDDGAEENAISQIAVGGTTLTPSDKKVTIPVDSAPASGSGNPVSSGAVYDGLANKQNTIADLGTIRSGAAAGATAVQPAAISDFITKSVDDLLNYYLKSETYTKAEVNALIGSTSDFHYEIYPTLGDVTTPMSNVLYLIGPLGSGSDKYEEYVYANSTFTKIGDTSIDLSGYVTVEALNAALSGYVTSEELILLLASKMDKPSSATEGNLAKFNGSKNPVDSGIPAENVAQKDGYYKQLTSGATEQIIGRPITVTDGYTEKPLALGADGALNEVSGKVTMNGLAGRVMGWNQHLKEINSTNYTELGVISIANGKILFTGNGNVYYQHAYIANAARPNLIKDHKYFIGGMVSDNTISLSDFRFTIGVNGMGTARAGFKVAGINGFNGEIYTATASEQIGAVGFSSTGTKVPEGETVAVSNIILIDLTLLAPSLAAKPNLTPADVEAWLAKRKNLKPYWPYNPGQLVGARMLGWTLPKTANLLNPTTGKARLVAYYNPGNTDNQYTVIGLEGLTDAVLTFTPDATGVAETITPDASNHFTISGDGELHIEASAGNLAQVCVLMTWDGSRDEENVPFDETSIEIDSANIYHLDNGVYTQVFEGGVMKATGDGAEDVRDEVGYDEATKKCYTKKMVGDVDLGTRTYNTKQQGQYLCFTVNITDRALSNKGITAFFANQIIEAVNPVVISNLIMDKSMVVLYYPGFTDKRIYFRDDAYSDAASFKIAMSGVHLWYELATPVIYTSDLYYKTGENTYIPLEEVFPIKAEGDNWATEALVQQDDDANGQPQSITPETTEVFTTDLREALLSLIDAQADNVNLSVLRSNLVAMCTALQSAGVIAGYTISATPTNGVYSFTFTK